MDTISPNHDWIILFPTASNEWPIAIITISDVTIVFASFWLSVWHEMCVCIGVIYTTLSIHVLCNCLQIIFFLFIQRIQCWCYRLLTAVNVRCRRHANAMFTVWMNVCKPTRMTARWVHIAHFAPIWCWWFMIDTRFSSVRFSCVFSAVVWHMLRARADNFSCRF